ncbi:inositol monophosphatase family protein [Micromonospora olivasterospora]|uniref:Inositol-1-monophosphatase n=1 Tax=Micromonospora olivasterospora TaxID=1880 RepID=A0A562IGI4_MICOL|nr:inositol monophosphatase family protein [Micromonospora olivasterospora]TWH70060.1 myo-inositol-1(or 4)-monophosphatase [Micromonospora olivasterospora]
MPTPDPGALLPVAHDVIDRAVAYILTNPVTAVRQKDAHEIVTDADIAIERLVRAALTEDDTRIGFLGEETGAVGNPDTYWVLDPIDGTTNFSHGLPLSSISLGLVHDGTPILGVIAVPFLARRYWATRAGGAYRDGTRIHVSKTADLSKALVALTDYGGPQPGLEGLLCRELDRELTTRAQGLRRLGSTAVELALVAEGSLDASISIWNGTWDTAAGAVIAREAGAVVMDADGSPHSTRSRCAVAVTPALRDALLSVLEIVRGTCYWPVEAGNTA